MQALYHNETGTPFPYWIGVMRYGEHRELAKLALRIYYHDDAVCHTRVIYSRKTWDRYSVHMFRTEADRVMVEMAMSPELLKASVRINPPNKGNK